MHDDAFREILRLHGLSWSGYRRVRRGVKKRLRDHMLALGCRSLTEYLERLESDREERQKGARLMDVSVSRFFRDRGLWEALEAEVLPGLMRTREESILAWSAGCACGEEAYSLKIVWQTLCSRFEHPPEFAIWATDANPDFLERARQGVYTRSSLRELPDEARTIFLEREPRADRYAVSECLKAGIRWQVHDLIREEAPSSGFHMVLLRNNLLTYYEKSMQIPAFNRVVSALKPGGMLIVGDREKLPPRSPPFTPLGRCPLILQKREESVGLGCR